MRQFFRGVLLFLLVSNTLDAIDWTNEEKAWLQTHKKIIVGGDYKWAPYEFLDEKGHHNGIAADYLTLISQKTGLGIESRLDVWSKTLAKMRGGELDALSCVVPTDERKEYLAFTTVYLDVPVAVFVREEGRKFKRIEDLYGHTVSVNKGSYLYEWLKTNHPKITVIASTSNDESVKAVAFGEADAYMGSMAVAEYQISRHLLKNLHLAMIVPGITTSVALAVGKENTVLLGILQKALDDITYEEHRSIAERWQMWSYYDWVKLTEQERRWIRKNPQISVAGDPRWAPISFLDEEGVYRGIVAEVFERIRKRSGLNLQYLPTKDWRHSLELMDRGEVMLLDAVTPNIKRREMMDFTHPYLLFDIAIITNEEHGFVRSLWYMRNKRIGTVTDYISQDYLERDFPNMDLSLYPDVDSGLKALSRGYIDAFVIDVPSFEYSAEKLGLTHLKVSGLTGYHYSLSIGVAKGNPELLAILNKSLKVISPEEKNMIYDRWLSIQGPLVDYFFVMKVAGVLLLVMGVIVYWNRRLRKEVDLRRQAEEKAIRATRAKSDFLANMSHEIRTPMNAILGFANLLERTPLTEQQKNQLEMIKSGGENLLALINDILDLSKIEAGKMDITPQVTDLYGTVHEIRQFFHQSAREKGLDLTTEYDPQELPRHVVIDENRLRQILFNLVSNAIKFTDEGRVTVRIRTTRKEVGRCGLLFEVEDTGKGIEESKQEVIFNSFEQIRDDRNKIVEGSGLGLAISKQLSLLMGGDLSVTSQPGKGSIFALQFNDIALSEPQSSLEEDKEPEGMHTLFEPATVLVVDDVRSNRALLQQMCAQLGLKVYEAVDGLEGLDQMRRYHPDIVLMDIRMPRMSGYEAMAVIQEEEGLRATPVIAVTASVLSADQENLKVAGFGDYIRKPFHLEAVVRVLRHYLPHRMEVVAQSGAHRSLPQSEERLETLSEAFLRSFDASLATQHNRVMQTKEFNQIMAFGIALKKLADDEGEVLVSHYARELLEAAKRFDVESIESFLKHFDKILTQHHHKRIDHE